MTMTVAETAPDTAAIEHTAPRRATLALARLESRRLLRHPLILGAVVLLVGFWASSWWLTNQANHYPVLQEVDRECALALMLLLGTAGLIAGNLAVLRQHRDGTTGLSRIMLLPDSSRTLAHLLALVPLALLGGALELVRIALLEVFTPAAGHPNPYELATGPATILLLGAIGVFLGRVTRSPVAAPLVVLALLASLLVVPALTNGLSNGGGAWLQPIVPQGDPNLPLPVPAYLMAEPVAAHLGYLLGLAGLFAVGAMMRAGARRSRTLAAGGVAVALMVAGALLQAIPISGSMTAARVDAMNHPSRHETCRQLDGVSYCAFADFTRWIPAWNTTVQAVLDEVPSAARPATLVVRQRIVVFGGTHGSGQAAEVPTADALRAWRADDGAAGTPNAVTATTRWGDSQSAATFATLVAERVVVGNSQANLICGGPGVLIIWLAGHSSALANTGMQKLVADQLHGGDGISFDQAGAPGVSVPPAELTVATEALQRPGADVAARVRDSWATLIAPTTTAAQAAQILGVAAPDGPANQRSVGEGCS